MGNVTTYNTDIGAEFLIKLRISREVEPFYLISITVFVEL